MNRMIVIGEMGFGKRIEGGNSRKEGKRRDKRGENKLVGIRLVWKENNVEVTASKGETVSNACASYSIVSLVQPLESKYLAES